MSIVVIGAQVLPPNNKVESWKLGAGQVVTCKVE